MAMKYNLTKGEQETIIRWDAANRIATIHVDIPSVMRKLDKLVEEFPEQYFRVNVDPKYLSATYKVNSRYIRFGRPASKETREARRRNLVFKREMAQGRKEF